MLIAIAFEESGALLRSPCKQSFWMCPGAGKYMFGLFFVSISSRGFEFEGSRVGLQGGRANALGFSREWGLGGDVYLNFIRLFLNYCQSVYYIAIY